MYITISVYDRSKTVYKKIKEFDHYPLLHEFWKVIGHRGVLSEEQIKHLRTLNTPFEYCASNGMWFRVERKENDPKS